MPQLIQPNRRVRRRGRKVKPPTKAQLAELRDQREEHHITLQMVAVEAAKTARFGTCGVPTVSEALYSGKSRNVLEALRRLIAQARESRNGAEAVAS